MGKLDSEEMCRRYLKSHVYLSASSIENSSNSVGEAMLLGMSCICRMFTDAAFALSCGKNAAKRAAVTHDPDTNYRRLVEIYEEMAAAKL